MAQNRDGEFVILVLIFVFVFLYYYYGAVQTQGLIGINLAYNASKNPHWNASLITEAVTPGQYSQLLSIPSAGENDGPIRLNIVILNGYNQQIFSKSYGISSHTYVIYTNRTVAQGEVVEVSIPSIRFSETLGAS